MADGDAAFRTHDKNGLAIPLDRQVVALAMVVQALSRELVETGRRIPSSAQVRTLLDEVTTMRSDEIRTLTEHAVKALQLLASKGVVTQDELNEVIR